MAIYNGEFKDVIAGAFNGVNKLPFPMAANEFNLGVPGVVTPPSKGFNYNTKAKLTPTQAIKANGDSYGGSADILYQRLDLGLLFKGIDIQWVTSSASTADFPLWVRTFLGVPMEDGDVQIVDIPSTANNSYITIKASVTSPWFIGSCKVFYTKGKPNINDLIEDNWNTGLYPALPSLDATYMATYYEDYTGNGALFRQSTNPSAIIGERIWKACLGSLPNQWRLGAASGTVYSGADKVIAAGGRKGFTGLMVVPALNIWAHFND